MNYRLISALYGGSHLYTFYFRMAEDDLLDPIHELTTTRDIAQAFFAEDDRILRVEAF